MIAAQGRWSSFGLARHQGWTFLQFSAVLLQKVLLYMMAGLVLPDVPPEEPVDLRANYYREQRPFCGIFFLMLAVSVSKDWILKGHLPRPENLAYHEVFATIALLAFLRKAAARTVDQLWEAIGQAIDAFSPPECAKYFAAAGYDAD